jgi:predicted phage-related endonuclease
MMNMNELVKEYRRYKRIADEAKAELDKLKPQIIAEMQGESTVIGDDYKIMYRVVRSARIDSAMLRREYPEIAEKVTKVAEANRLTVN